MKVITGAENRETYWQRNGEQAVGDRKNVTDPPFPMTARPFPLLLCCLSFWGLLLLLYLMVVGLILILHNRFSVCLQPF